MNRQEYVSLNSVEKNHFWFWAKILFLKVVFSHNRVPKKAHIVDVGCGCGNVLSKLQSWGYKNAAGIDVSTTALEFCREMGLKNVFLSQENKLPFKNESIDVAVCLDVLEHIKNDSGYLGELWRILKPNGRIIMMVPAHRFLWSYHDEHLGHYRRYSKAAIRERFLAAGFPALRISYIHALCFFLLIPFRILRRQTNQMTSDVRCISSPLNLFIKFSYIPELLFFSIFHWLPFGSSILVISRKS